MAGFCELTGTGPHAGKTVSHSNRHTPRRFLPNLQRKRYDFPELGRSISLRLSTRAIRTIDALGGISRAILLADKNKLSDRLLKIRYQLERHARRGKPTAKTKAA